MVKQMDFEKTLAYIHSLNKFGMKPGLERISLLLENLGNPQDKLQYVHVAGTNGKGSVCTMLSNIFIAAGKKTGLFISPYVVCFNERIQINGAYIPNQALSSLTAVVRRAAETVNEKLGDPVTEFEFITALAFLWFLQNRCDIVVLETGLGGRLDSTNIISQNLVSVITKINLDHTAVLGNTVEQIALEKCGIIKPGAAVVSSNEQLAPAAAVIKQVAAAKNNCVIVADTGAITALSCSASGSTFNYHGLSVVLNLPGRYQLYNAVESIEAALYLKIPPNAIVQGLANTQFPCRLEQLCDSPLTVIDGAHNPDGALALAEYLKEQKLHPVAIAGMMADKECEAVIQTIAPLCRQLIAVTVLSNPRAIPADKLAALAKPYTPVTAAESYPAALDSAFAAAKAENLPVLIFGSLYLASDIRPLAIEQLQNL